MGSPIVVVDYQMGNVRSVRNALARVGAEAVLTSDPAALVRALQERQGRIQEELRAIERDLQRLREALERPR